MAVIIWRTDKEATEEAQSWRTFRRQRPTCRDSRTRCNKDESSSRWKERAQGSELSRRLSSMGEITLVSVTGTETGTCWHTCGYNGSTARL